MAGIFCLLLPEGTRDGRPIAEKLAAGMPVFAHQTAQAHEVIPDRLWLGTVSNGPSTNGVVGQYRREGDIHCAVEGMLLRPLEAVGAAAAIKAGDHAAAVIAAYRARGVQAAAALEGQFNFVLADLSAGRLLIADSRHGHSPLFVGGDPGAGGFIAASRLGPLVACGLLEAELDLEAITDFLAYGQLIDDESYVRGVSVLDSATVVEIDLRGPGSCRRRRYWDYDSLTTGEPDRDLGVVVGEVAEVLTAAIDRIMARPGRIATGLSGGNDSRLVAGLAARRGSLAFAWTFGTPDAADVRVATEISRRLGLEHRVYPLAIEHVPDHAQALVDAVDGSLSVEFAHGLVRAADLREHADLVLNGYAGEVFVRGSMVNLGPKAWKPYGLYRMGRGPLAPRPKLAVDADLEQIGAFIAGMFGRPGSLAPMLSAQPRPLRQKVARQLEKDRHLPWPLLVERWILEDRGRRRTMMGVVMDRHFYGDACPFYDYELHDRCLCIHPRLRHGQRLFIPLLRSLMPDLCRIPNGNTGLPPTAPAWQVAGVKAWRRWRRRHGRAALSTGVRTDAAARATVGVYYADLLGEARARARPFWDGEALASHAAAFRDGAAVSGRELGLAVAVELFLRRWVDPATV